MGKAIPRSFKPFEHSKVSEIIHDLHYTNESGDSPCASVETDPNLNGTPH